MEEQKREEQKERKKEKSVPTEFHHDLLHLWHVDGSVHPHHRDRDASHRLRHRRGRLQRHYPQTDRLELSVHLIELLDVLARPHQVLRHDPRRALRG